MFNIQPNTVHFVHSFNHTHYLTPSTKIGIYYVNFPITYDMDAKFTGAYCPSFDVVYCRFTIDCLEFC